MRQKLGLSLIVTREAAKDLGECQVLKYVTGVLEAESVKQGLDLGKVLDVNFVPLSFMKESFGGTPCLWNSLWHPLMDWWTEVKVIAIHELEESLND